MIFYLIAGLGNPGSKYDKTRHNIGFRVVDNIVKNHKESFKDFEKVGKLATVRVGKIVFLLYKPMTFMNLSGEPILKLMDYFDVETEDLLIVYDEMGMQPGAIKYSLGGGHNGHNGVANVIRMMQTKDFKRAKFGVGRPLGSNMEKHVLSQFPKAKEKFIDSRVKSMSKALSEYIQHQDFSKLQNDYNVKTVVGKIL